MKKLLYSALIFIFMMHVKSDCDELVIGRIHESNPEITYNQDTLKQAIQLTLNDGTVINNVEIQGNTTLYLIANGINSNNALNIACELSVAEVDGTIYLYLNSSKTTHECKGQPCSCCDFKYLSDVIIGCLCQGYPGCTGTTCNHEIKSGFQYQFIEILNEM